MELFRKVKKTPTSSAEAGPGTARHEKLGEGWAENRQPVAGDDGVVFYLKYLGYTLVDEVDGDESYADGSSAKAVKRIVAMAKSEGKTLRKVALKVSCKGIQIVDIDTKEMMADISIYRISFCTADKNHDKVFAFIARNTINETMDCHAFLCAKSKIAQAVTLTVWQSFSVAEERWSHQQKQKKAIRSSKNKSNGKSCHSNTQQQQQQDQRQVPSQKEAQLIDLDSPTTPVKTQQTFTPPPSSSLSSPFHDSFADYSIADISVGNGSHNNSNNKSPFDDGDDSLEDSFSKLAETRGRDRVPSFSTDLTREEVDESVKQYMDGTRCFEEFSRTKSFEDLLSL